MEPATSAVTAYMSCVFLCAKLKAHHLLMELEQLVPEAEGVEQDDGAIVET